MIAASQRQLNEEETRLQSGRTSRTVMLNFVRPMDRGQGLMPTARSLASWVQGNKMNRIAGFSIDFVSDMDHEHLMAEISFNDQRLCVLDKEDGGDKTEIEFLVDLRVFPESVRMKFSLAEFLKTIEIARSDLEKCA